MWLLDLASSVWDQNDEIIALDVLALTAQTFLTDVGAGVQELVVFLIPAGILVLARKFRSTAARQIKLARENDNLRRYIPQETAQLLTQHTDPLWQTTERSAAVLFADLVAFTSWSEKRKPIEIIGLLQEIHGLLADIVLRHNGTVDKFIGDGLMATFGTQDPTRKDASNALLAMLDMIDEFERWKQTNGGFEDSDHKLAIGAHYGSVAIGNIGTMKRLECAVLGDTVNVASRLERATREVGCSCLASAALIKAAEAEIPEGNASLALRLTDIGQISLSGRSEKITVFAVYKVCRRVAV